MAHFARLDGMSLWKYDIEKSEFINKRSVYNFYKSPEPN